MTLKWPQNNYCVQQLWKNTWGHDAQIVGSGLPLTWGYRKLWTLRSLNTDIACFSNLVKTWRLGKNEQELVCWREHWEGWERRLGKSPADLRNFDLKKPKNSSPRYLCQVTVVTWRRTMWYITIQVDQFNQLYHLAWFHSEWIAN